MNLCLECGLCCNGVLFHSVRLQPNDSPRELAALGLRLKYKKKQYSILQPCPAHQNGQCSIYSDRPERCRAFECQQLRRVAAGETTEAAALEKIRAARQLVERVQKLLSQAGAKNEKKSFITRYEAILAQPLDASSDPSEAELRRQLVSTFSILEETLQNEFRLAPHQG